MTAAARSAHVDDVRNDLAAQVAPEAVADVDAVSRGWDAIRNAWMPFEAYVRDQAQANRKLGSHELRTFVSGFEETLRSSGMNVVSARMEGALPSNMAEGKAYEIVAVRPDHFPNTHRTFSLSSIHLFASRGRLWLRTYDNPFLWRVDHVPERVQQRAGERVEDPTLLVARRLFKAAPLIAAAREACRRLGHSTFVVPFGSGMMAGNFRHVAGLASEDTGNVILDYGRNGAFMNAYGRPIRGDEATVDVDDPYAFAMVRTFFGPEEKDYWWDQMRNRLAAVEERFEGSTRTALASMFRPFSVVDPVPRFRPDPAMVDALARVYDDPSFRHHFRRTWAQEAAIAARFREPRRQEPPAPAPRAP